MSSQPRCSDDAVGCIARPMPTASVTSGTARFFRAESAPLAATCPADRQASLLEMSLPGMDAMAQLSHSWCRAIVPHWLNARATLPASLTLPTDWVRADDCHL